jgi:putative heme-binding domain-containing protein
MRGNGHSLSVWLAALACVSRLAPAAEFAGQGERLPPPGIPTEAPSLPSAFHLDPVWTAATNLEAFTCLAQDESGRWLLAPRHQETSLLQLELDSTGSVERQTLLPTPLQRFRGLVCAWGAIYAAADGPDGVGIYRLVDSNANAAFEPAEVRSLLSLGVAEERGFRALAAGPERQLYVLCGSLHVTSTELSASSPWKRYGPARLLPPVNDPTSAAVRAVTPIGCVLRTDPEGNKWVAWMGGFHDPWDLTVDGDGEVFITDRETDSQRGLPWHRPAGVFHGLAGGDPGWRPAGAAWFDAYPDTLPPIAELGFAKPSGLVSGARTRFPEPYRHALFVGDPAQNRLLVVHLTPQGTGYRGSTEVFAQHEGLDTAALAAGDDGALYLLTGARQGPARLLRLRYDDDNRTTVAVPRSAAEAEAAEMRKLRHRLIASVEASGPLPDEPCSEHLNSPDPRLRYLARLGLENRANVPWAERLSAATNLANANALLLAWSRSTPVPSGQDFLAAWLHNFQRQRTDLQMLAALRALEWGLTRMGPLRPGDRQALLALLDPLYPAPSEPLNRSLAGLLVFLEAPVVIPRTLALIEATPTMEEQIHLLTQLRCAESGWTPALRREFFRWLDRVEAGGAISPKLRRWFEEAGLAYAPTKDVAGVLAAIRNEAVAQLSETERRELAGAITPHTVTAPQSASLGRKPSLWRMEDFETLLRETRTGSAVERGRAAFDQGQCRTCHRFGREGGSVGPDLTAVAQRLNRREIIESILLPSRQILERYRNATLTLKDGEEVAGRLLEEAPGRLHVLTNPLTGASQWVRRSEIGEVTLSALSPMPEGLVAFLTQEEILDLVTFLGSGLGPPASDGAR